jgi:hypothetical protein
MYFLKCLKSLKFKILMRNIDEVLKVLKVLKGFIKYHRPQAMFKISAHCSIVTVSIL